LNSSRFLELCLSSIERQKYRNFEIIVVDDYSQDNTIDIAKKHGCRIIKNSKRGRAEAKNLGAYHSSGKYLLFLDSDMELTERVILDCVELIDRNSKIGGIVIPEHSIGNNILAKIRDYERSFYFGSIIESARFFPTKLFKMVNGFEENLIFFEEATLPFKISKIGYNVFSRVNSWIIHHEEDFSLFKWLKKKYNYGKTSIIYHRKYRDYSIKQTNVIFRIRLFMKNKKKILKQPMLFLCLICLKSLEYFMVSISKYLN
jgi:glycosyltransferase involved in cell wall biosynthesis